MSFHTAVAADSFSFFIISAKAVDRPRLRTLDRPSFQVPGQLLPVGGCAELLEGELRPLS